MVGAKFQELGGSMYFFLFFFLLLCFPFFRVFFYPLSFLIFCYLPVVLKEKKIMIIFFCFSLCFFSCALSFLVIFVYLESFSGLPNAEFFLY